MSAISPILISTVQYDAPLRAGRVPLVEVLRVARRLGVAGVELRDVYWHDRATELPQCRALAAELDLTLTYATFATIFGAAPDGPPAVRQAIDDAAMLGAPLLRVFPGPAPLDPDDPAWTAARALLEHASAHGVVLALENYARVPGNRLAEVKWVLDQLPSRALGTNVDIGNYAANGQDVPTAIRTLGPRVVSAHLKHQRQTADGAESTYLGGGDAPLTETLDAFRRLPQRILYCFEFGGGNDPEGRIAASVAYLKEH
jgi:sugar phosphate isomerase/epimerase